MSDSHNPLSGDRPVPSVPLNTTRRRLFQGVAGGTGVLLSVHAKTALGATVCKSPSAMFSGNTSPRPDSGVTCSGGRSPGYWVQPQHFGAWSAAGAFPPTFNPALQECAPGVDGLALSAIATSGTTFLSVFGNDLVPKAGVVVQRPVSLWAVIYDPNSFGSIGQVARHLACAWLNANFFLGSSAQYPLMPAQVIDMWKAVSMGGLYCPANTTCAGGGWNADQVKSYIENMYDINAPVPNYCKSQ